jgi:phosphohistidine phosphatase
LKTLHLLRHAKSDWDNPGLADDERPLNARGKRDSKRLAQHLQKHPIQVDMVFCSPARRAKQTLKPIQPVLGVKVTEEPDLYGASSEELLKLVRRTPGKLHAILLIGHNPGFEELARGLVPPEQAPEGLPTCTLATITFDAADWKAVGPGKGTLAALLTPAAFDA